MPFLNLKGSKCLIIHGRSDYASQRLVSILKKIQFILKYRTIINVLNATSNGALDPLAIITKKIVSFVSNGMSIGISIGMSIFKQAVENQKSSGLVTEALSVFFQWDADNIYLILEWCSGGDLSRFIRSRRILPEIVARRFLQQIGESFILVWRTHETFVVLLLLEKKQHWSIPALHVHFFLPTLICFYSLK